MVTLEMSTWKIWCYWKIGRGILKDMRYIKIIETTGKKLKGK